MIMGLSWMTWAVGAMVDHEILSLAFLNLFHGIPSMVIVWWVCNERYKDKEDFELPLRDKLNKMLTATGNWPYYLGFMFVLAIFEDVLWE